ncbi:MAG: winged helix-turn-helix transcriptional regulator, partial [bacterium]|nr:winged helix-turn-helix transcriptional regulator [bacterium]
MGLIEECISELIFEKTNHWDFNEITLSGKKIFVLSEINGKSSLKELCKRLNIGLSEIKNIINELGKLNLIKRVVMENGVKEPLVVKTKEAKTDLCKNGTDLSESGDGILKSRYKVPPKTR